MSRVRVRGDGGLDESRARAAVSGDIKETVDEFRKEWVDPESMRVWISVAKRRLEVRVIMRELGS